MDYKLIQVGQDNYHHFDDMVYWRINGRERSHQDKLESIKNLIIPKALFNENFYVYAIEIDNRFAGWISLIYLPKVGRKDFNGFVYVDELWVQESFRRMGFAKLLMKQAEELSSRLDTVGIRLGVNVNNPGAKVLYEACGYETTGQAYTMEKR
ncbi:GNAT family N-acetyltransferase [Acidaminobacter sp. JC074]|uniref:GNAT family N-acetyltransferase n=1 Tax=Acidaminobacter sp. JC074 TaxID=2530199 RepID=UPI001F1183D8|nr:GNAT family N-acetyltransferase [Acidaminobacter sp. JC074]MCH4887856.1 GNAT family N-acetyltransferase [Acidaminobacter sp. JC074]